MFLNFSWCELKLLTSDICGKRPMIEPGEVPSAKDTPVPTGAPVIESSTSIQHFTHTQNFLSSHRNALGRSGIFSKVVENSIGL